MPKPYVPVEVREAVETVVEYLQNRAVAAVDTVNCGDPWWDTQKNVADRQYYYRTSALEAVKPILELV